jgi:hypothetical protein
MNERRRDKRLGVELPITLKVGKKPLFGTTVNVSFHGISVNLDEPPPIRQLVQVELDLAPGKAFSAHMMVVHVADKNIGLEFFGRSNNPDWDEFVQGLMRSPTTNPRLSAPPPLPVNPRVSAPPGPDVDRRSNAPNIGVVAPVGALAAPLANNQLGTNPNVGAAGPSLLRPPQSAPPGPYAGPERRRAPRIQMKLELRLRTPRSIHTAFTSDVSMIGATLLVSDLSAGIGESLIVNLIQPGTSFSFRRDGVLKWARPLEAPWTQVGVEFSNLEQMRELLFAEFMNTAYAVLQKSP